MSFARMWRVDLQQNRRGWPSELGGGKVRCNDKGNAYVADAVRGVVYKFNINGELIDTVDGLDADVKLVCARDIALGHEGHLFVADLGSGEIPPKIVQFDDSGRWVRTVGVATPPESLAVDRDGFIYIHSPLSEWRVQKFTATGEHIASFGTRPTRVSLEALATSTTREKLDLYEFMSTIAVGDSTRLYFARASTYDVQQYSTTGQPLKRIQQPSPDNQDVAVSDISVPWGRDFLYVLLGRGEGVIDIWEQGGKQVTQVCLEEPAYSIACEPSGGIYLLYSNVPAGVIQLSKYSPT